MTTIDFYQTHAKDFFSQTKQIDMQNVYQPFLEHLPNFLIKSLFHNSND